MSSADLTRMDGLFCFFLQQPVLNVKKQKQCVLYTISLHVLWLSSQQFDRQMICVWVV